MRQEVPKEYGISHWDHTQLVRGEADLANGLTVAYKHLVHRDMLQLQLIRHKPQTATKVQLWIFYYLLFHSNLAPAGRTDCNTYKRYLWVHPQLHAVIPNFHSIVSRCQQESTVFAYCQGRALVSVHLGHLSEWQDSGQTRSHFIWKCIKWSHRYKNLDFYIEPIHTFI